MRRILHLLLVTLMMAYSTVALASWAQYTARFNNARFSGAGLYNRDGRELSTNGDVHIGPKKAQQLFTNLAADKPFKKGVTIAGTQYRVVESARNRIVGVADGHRILVYRTSKTLVVAMARSNTQLNQAKSDMNGVIRSLKDAGK